MLEYEALLLDRGLTLLNRSRVPFLALLALPWVCGSAFGQGAASTGRAAAPRRPLPPGLAVPRIAYRDVAKEAGLLGVSVSGSETAKTYIVESTGPGVAIFDYNGDGLQDILLLSADRFEASNPPPRHYLYQNQGGLRFKDRTKEAGIDHTGWAQGVCAGDFDRDGKVDFYLPHWGLNRLYRNTGDGFAEESEARGVQGEADRWSTGCAFLDYDGDGDLDLFVANYIALDLATTPKPGDSAECRWKGAPVLCGPRGLPAETMTLYRNDDGSFTDVSAAAGVSGDRNYYGFTPIVSDFDGDGLPDVFVTCDSTANLLFRNLGEGRFEELGIVSGAAFNADGMEQAGMGVAVADYDGDSDFDLLVTNFSNDSHALYRNDGDWFFSDETIPSGLAVNTRYVGWGTLFLDFDHDGWKDLFVANGHVYPSVDQENIGELYRQPRLLYWNRGDGQFHDVSAAAGAGIAATHSSRGAAVGDLDNDGVLEIVVVNLGEAPSLLVASAPAGRSLLVEALDSSGGPAIGARIEVRTDQGTRIDEVRSGGSFLSQSDFRLHFGVGAASAATLVVRWPDGERRDYGEIAAGEWTTVTRDQGVTRRRQLGAR